MAGLLALRNIVATSRRLVVLTGAGMSTESGIPDYRSPERPPHKPFQHQHFMGSAATRQRYWARSFVGFLNVSGAHPNIGHRTLAFAESAGKVQHVLTQNVDQLHQTAGSQHVLNMHGNIHVVVCMSCRVKTARKDLQKRLLQLNPWFSPEDTSAVRPDGDVNLRDSDYKGFRVPECEQCGGVLKPDVVFFGDSLEATIKSQATALVDQADALLALGTSLTVFSAYRLVRQALDKRLPVGIVNSGPTRADSEATVKVDARLGDVIPALFELPASQLSQERITPRKDAPHII